MGFLVGFKIFLIIFSKVSLGETIKVYDADIKGRGEVISVKATAERRLEIRNFISVQRHTSVKELMSVFGVSRSTVLRDLDALAETISYYTTSGNGGGIHAMDGWYAGNYYLKKEDEDFLRMVIADRLESPEEKAWMERIVSAFVRPRMCS